jgi:hypothetical protein
MNQVPWCVDVELDIAQTKGCIFADGSGVFARPALLLPEIILLSAQI